LIILLNVFFYEGITGIVVRWSSVLLAYGWILLSAVIHRRLTLKFFKKILGILAEECDPERFIAIYLPLTKKKMKKSYMVYLSVLVTGYVAAGKEEMAVDVLKDVMSYPREKIDLNNQVAYYRNLYNYFFLTKDYKNAENVLFYLKGILDHSNYKKALRNNYARSYILSRCQLNIAQGFFDGSEGVLGTLFENAESRYSRVSAKYLLGLVYLHQSEKDKAAAAFEYVVGNGNKLALVEEAKKYLSLNGEEPAPE
jgi:tetratricopeptide (TPR) repeat protein